MPAAKGVAQLAEWAWNPPLGRGQVPTQSAVSVSLVVESGAFVWLAVSAPFPWPLAIGLALSVGAVLAVALTAGPDAARRQWPRRTKLAIGLALGLDVLLSAFLGLLIILILADEAITGKGLAPLLITPLVIAVALYANVGVVLLLTLSLLLILATGVLIETGPIAFLAIPLVLSAGVAVILFEAISPTPSKELRITRLR